MPPSDAGQDHQRQRSTSRWRRRRRWRCRPPRSRRAASGLPRQCSTRSRGSPPRARARSGTAATPSAAVRDQPFTFESGSMKNTCIARTRVLADQLKIRKPMTSVSDRRDERRRQAAWRGTASGALRAGRERSSVTSLMSRRRRVGALAVEEARHEKADLFGVGVARSRRTGESLPRAMHGEAVADLEEFFQLFRDHQDRDAARRADRAAAGG